MAELGSIEQVKQATWTIVGLLLKQESLWIIGGRTFGFGGAVMMGFLLRAKFFHASAASVPRFDRIIDPASSACTGRHGRTSSQRQH
jgi:hypothetical protein